MKDFFKKKKVNVSRREIRAVEDRLTLRSLQVLEPQEMSKLEGGKASGFVWVDMSYGSFCCSTLPQ